MWWLIPVVAVVLLIGVLVIRTLHFTPKEGPLVDDAPISFDREAAVSHLQQLVRCKTVSYRDHALEDEAEFQKLLGLLPTLYPHVFAACSMEQLEERGILIAWPGKQTTEPAVLMAHYDVVPVEADGWAKPPFAGVIEDSVLWGRGALDTKVTMNGILSAADHLIADGFVPEHTVYMAFSGGEEVNGLGAVKIVDWFETRGITPGFVLDEGGAVVENVFPGVSAPCGMIGIGEKGMLNVAYTVKSSGGHASAPKPGGPIDRLSGACQRILRKPFPYHITPPVAAMFDTLGRYSTFLYRMIFSNLWLFKPVLNSLCKKSGGELNALMRTTVAFTQMQGSQAANVIPPSARMISNIRLNPDDTMEGALSYLRKVVDDPHVEITAIEGMNPSRLSRVDCDGWHKVAGAVASTWKGCIVSPYLMVQCSDSRHYGRISDRVYRFSAMDLTAEERGTIHGHNERIRLDALYRTVEFYIRLMKSC